MHELGVTFYVVKDVKKVAQENKVDKIDYVKLEIGEVSGVVHDQLIDCWNWARKKRSSDGTCKNVYRNIRSNYLL